MILRSVALPKTRRFCSSKTALRRTFQDVESLSVNLRGRAFRFDSRCPQPPQLRGTVVTSLTVTRALKAFLSFYPVSTKAYGSTPHADFEARILPRLRQWLLQQIGKPQTAILGCEELIIEWTDDEHREHSVRYL